MLNLTVFRIGMALTAIVVLAPATSADSRFDYLLHCGGCHLEDGSGSPPEVPDLRRDLDRLAATDEGRSYLTRVPGASQVPLSDDDLAAVFNWMFDTYYPNGNVTPFTGQEIARTRYQPLFDPLKTRETLTTARR